MKSSYRDLIAWQKAMDLVDSVYAVVRAFPKHELFNLVSQMRSSASSVAANIAEGRGRGTNRDFRGFLRKARASLMELETHIEIARRQRYVSDADAERLFAESLRVVRLINGLIRRLTSLIDSGEQQAASGKRT